MENYILCCNDGQNGVIDNLWAPLESSRQARSNDVSHDLERSNPWPDLTWGQVKVKKVILYIIRTAVMRRTRWRINNFCITTCIEATEGWRFFPCISNGEVTVRIWPQVKGGAFHDISHTGWSILHPHVSDFLENLVRGLSTAQNTLVTFLGL